MDYSMAILESGENYLECILMLQQEKGYVRSVDIAERLSFSKPSVSVALKKLKESDHVVMREDNHVELTATGLVLAQKVYGKHLALCHVLKSFGVPDDIAAAAACRIEHVVSDETMACIQRYIDNLSE